MVLEKLSLLIIEVLHIIISCLSIFYILIFFIFISSAYDNQYILTDFQIYQAKCGRILLILFNFVSYWKFCRGELKEKLAPKRHFVSFFPTKSQYRQNTHQSVNHQSTSQPYEILAQKLNNNIPILDTGDVGVTSLSSTLPVNKHGGCTAVSIRAR